MDCRRRLRKIRLHSLSAAAGTEAPHSPNRPREGRGPCRLGVPFSKPRKEAISSLRFLGLCYLGLLLQILKKMWYLLMDILESVRRVCRQGTCVCEGGAAAARIHLTLGNCRYIGPSKVGQSRISHARSAQPPRLLRDCPHFSQPFSGHFELLIINSAISLTSKIFLFLYNNVFASAAWHSLAIL